MLSHPTDPQPCNYLRSYIFFYFFFCEQLKLLAFFHCCVISFKVRRAFLTKYAYTHTNKYLSVCVCICILRKLQIPHRDALFTFCEMGAVMYSFLFCSWPIFSSSPVRPPQRRHRRRCHYRYPRLAPPPIKNK